MHSFETRVYEILSAACTPIRCMPARNYVHEIHASKVHVLWNICSCKM